MDIPLLTSGCAGLQLFNCDYSQKRVLAGVAVVSPGLPDVMEMYSESGQRICELQTHAQTRLNRTPSVVSSFEDDIEFIVTKDFTDNG